jgi:sarcosine oxidase delta subunit
MSCPFCKGSNKIKDSEFKFVGNVSAKIEGSQIKLHILTGDGGGRDSDSYRDAYIPIIYCPLCGDKLEVV